MTTADETLAQRAQAGDADAFEALVRRYQVPLLHFLRKRTSTSDAEDLLQDTFLRAYRHLARYSPARPFRPWLCTIAHGLCLSHHRRVRPAIMLEAVGGLAQPGPSELDRLGQAESRRDLWDKVASLVSQRQFTALWLHCVESMPPHQIATVVGRSAVAVRAMLFRARMKLKAGLEHPDRAPVGPDVGHRGATLATQESPA